VGAVVSDAGGKVIGGEAGDGGKRGWKRLEKAERGWKRLVMERKKREWKRLKKAERR